MTTDWSAPNLLLALDSFIRTFVNSGSAIGIRGLYRNG